MCGATCSQEAARSLSGDSDLLRFSKALGYVVGQTHKWGHPRTAEELGAHVTSPPSPSLALCCPRHLRNGFCREPPET